MSHVWLVKDKLEQTHTQISGGVRDIVVVEYFYLLQWTFFSVNRRRISNVQYIFHIILVT